MAYIQAFLFPGYSLPAVSAFLALALGGFLQYLDFEAVGAVVSYYTHSTVLFRRSHAAGMGLILRQGGKGF